MPDRKLLVTAGVIGALWIFGALFGARAASGDPVQRHPHAVVQAAPHAGTR